MTESRNMESLRQEALSLMRSNEPELALERFDQALGLAADDESRELVTINKAFALVQLERMSDPVVQALPRIVMRRRTPRHVLLAAYSLVYKNRLEQDFTRARFYGRIALEAMQEVADQIDWKPAILTEIGNVSLLDSKFDEAIEQYDAALELLDESPGSDYARAFILQNLGYCKLLRDETEAGIELIHRAIDLMERTGAGSYAAESHIDLCLGYMEFGDLESARFHGEKGLQMATEQRQIRNAHYLLGEVAHKTGDLEGAEAHFGQLARLYPDFPYLKDLLLAIDLRAMVNWKL